MGVLHPYPVRLLLGADGAYLVVGRTPFPLDKHSGVDDVGEDALDGHILPFRPLPGAESCLEVDALHPLVVHRGGDAAGIEPPRYLQDGEPVLEHPEDHGHDLGGVLVHQQSVFILRGFFVAVGGKAAHILALFPFDLQAGAYLDGDVPAVDVVHQHLERQGDGVGTRSGGHAVVVVVDGNIADAHRGENLFQIVPGVDIVP